MFNVRCSLCHQVLTSHQTAQAHFKYVSRKPSKHLKILRACFATLPFSRSSSVRCRHGCAVAKAEKTVVQVMQRLQVRGQCSLCCRLFFSQAEITSHKESTHHGVEINKTMQKAVLQHGRFSETQQHAGRERVVQQGGQPGDPESPSEKTTNGRSACEEYSAKRKKAGPSGSDGASSRSAVSWCCECGLRFSEEAAARKHLFAANQIFHQCGVCGKHMGESPITRLHMSRFHGGAHLSNFLFYCRKCKIEMPRYEDILSHVAEHHRGHAYFTEQEMPEELPAIFDAQPSTSRASTSHFNPAPLTEGQSWMCRMCEDVFDSEEDVLEHCGDVSSHSFQRFMCGHCPQKFFKESTVRRHCANEHAGQIKSFHFCGLCDSIQFECEGEFLDHYRSLHSKDYYCLDGDGAIPSPAQPTCPCMGSGKSREELRSTYTRCMRDLAAQGKCQYTCAPCGVLASSYAHIKTHVHTKHPALNLEKTFDVACRACPERFQDVPSFHKHYHSQHCALAPCTSSSSLRAKTEPISVKLPNAVEIRRDSSGNLLSSSLRTNLYFIQAFSHFSVISEICDETLAAFLNEDQASRDGTVDKGREEWIIAHLTVAAVFLQIDEHTYSRTLFPTKKQCAFSRNSCSFGSVADEASDAASLSAEEESAGSPCCWASAAPRRAFALCRIVLCSCGDLFKHPVTGLFVSLHLQSWKKQSKEVL